MAQNTSIKPIFSRDQRADLMRMGLCDVEINELEIYLPLCRAWLGRPPKLQDVRDAIESLHSAMKKAHGAMTNLRTATPLMEAKFEALVRLQLVDEDGEIDRAMQALEIACSVVQRTQKSLTTKQRRHRTADIAPVRLIDKALLQGFIKRPSTNSTDSKTGQRQSNPVRPYTLRRSYSPKSKYRKIMGICYEAIGQESDPVRAIKAFIAWRRRTDKRMRKEIDEKVRTETK